MENKLYNKLSDSLRVQEKERASLLKKKAKENLKRVVMTKIKTTMIGAIAKAEKAMGPKFWGFGLSEEQCTDEQLDNEVIWERLREEILDLGNKQIRAALAELDLYDVEWRGYRYQFNIKN